MLKELEPIVSYTHAPGSNTPIAAFVLKDNTVTFVEVYVTSLDLSTNDYSSYFDFWTIQKLNGIVDLQSGPQVVSECGGSATKPVTYIEIGAEDGMAKIIANVTSANLVQHKIQINLQENSLP